MALDQLNRRLSLLAAVFAFIGVILGAVALGTNYWTRIRYDVPSRATETVNGTMFVNERVDWIWNGLFYYCSTRENVPCVSRFLPATFILCLIGLIFLLVSGIFLCWDFVQITDRRFVIPMLVFVSCVFITAGLVEYGSMVILNSHSSRTMIAALVFAFATLPISSFIAGRHSTMNHYVNNGCVSNGQKYHPTSNGN